MRSECLRMMREIVAECDSKSIREFNKEFTKKGCQNLYKLDIKQGESCVNIYKKTFRTISYVEMLDFIVSHKIGE